MEISAIAYYPWRNSGATRRDKIACDFISPEVSGQVVQLIDFPPENCASGNYIKAIFSLIWKSFILPVKL